MSILAIAALVLFIVAAILHIVAPQLANIAHACTNAGLALLVVEVSGVLAD